MTNRSLVSSTYEQTRLCLKLSTKSLINKTIQNYWFTCIDCQAGSKAPDLLVEYLLNEHPHDLQQAKRSRHPLVYHESELVPHIQYPWIQMEKVSPYRIRASSMNWLPHYQECPAHLRTQLLRMSGATLGRYSGEIRETLKVQRGVSTTAPANFMKNKISKPGHTLN
jgi:hypothetical protein